MINRLADFMKNTIHFFYLLFLLIGCMDYQNKEYHATEIKAINDILPELIDSSFMLQYDEYKGTTLLLDSLYSNLKGYNYDIYEDIPSDIEIEEKVEVNKALLNPLFTDRFQSIPCDIEEINQIPGIMIKVIDKHEAHRMDSLGCAFFLDSDSTYYGYLKISRISFNKKKTIGYLDYGFICGGLCAWGGLIQIRREGEKWIVDEEIYTWIS